jgi:alkanesulfonate monooxygenase SsuD/methylene tetrahydromethanopterin reductase-like flavin-dependent oxidoreductase (luciferase family)
LQPGGIPFWIAGGGEKVTLRVAAQYADYTNFDGTPKGFRHKSAVLAGHCSRLGRDFDAISRSANYNIAIGRDEKEVADRIDWIRDHLSRTVGAARAERQLSGFIGLPGVGTPEQIVEKLSALKSDGLSYAIANFPELAYDTSGLDLFEQEVIPALR